MRSLLVVSVLIVGALPAQVSGTVQTIDGRQLTGELTVADGVAVLRSGEGETRIDVRDLLAFERAGSQARTVKTDHRVWLRSGSELPVKQITGRAAADGKPSVLLARLPSGITVELPISTIRAIRHGGLMRPRPNLFRDDLSEPPANNDLIYVVKNGQAQRSAVTVTGIGATEIDFDLRGNGYGFELDGLAAVVFGSNTGFAPDRQPRPRTVVSLTTGERLEGKLLTIGKQVRCRIDEGAVVDIPLSKLHRLDVSSDRLVWLSDLQPKVDQTPAFDRVWAWHADRSEVGPGFELSGAHFDRGIGMVPYTRLTYQLDGRFDVFEAMIGIDDRGGPEAHAIFRVFVDGKQAFESSPMTRGQSPEQLRIALHKANTFAIEVDFGKNYDLGDFCTFALARVMQQ